MIRAIDFSLALIALLVLSPLLLAIMLILRFTGEGEVFYSQNRVGRDGKEFPLLKFATMLKESPNLPGGYLTRHNDPRILPFGKFLRKTKLNELPQLINVLKGEMSIVGPRPQARPHFELYSPEIQKEISKVPPGLTGVGSIIFRSEDAILAKYPDRVEEIYRDVIAPYKGELELWFVRNRSLKLYFILILLTAWVVFVPATRLPDRLLKGLPPSPAAVLV